MQSRSRRSINRLRSPRRTFPGVLSKPAPRPNPLLIAFPSPGPSLWLRPKRPFPLPALSVPVVRLSPFRDRRYGSWSVHFLGTFRAADEPVSRDRTHRPPLPLEWFYPLGPRLQSTPRVTPDDLTPRTSNGFPDILGVPDSEPWSGLDLCSFEPHSHRPSPSTLPGPPLVCHNIRTPGTRDWNWCPLPLPVLTSPCPTSQGFPLPRPSRWPWGSPSRRKVRSKGGEEGGTSYDPSHSHPPPAEPPDEVERQEAKILRDFQLVPGSAL